MPVLLYLSDHTLQTGLQCFRANATYNADPLKQLKDLASLKDQLEDIQKKVENEVQAGIPQGGSLLESPFLKGFVAGYIVSRLRSSAILGVVLGACTGMYVAQNFDVPNIERTLKDYFQSLKKGPK
ncbi:SLC35A4 upstream open reading frame protein-like isoform X1 [Brienomyrus brachyistius]|uniref:SLC35A4 upstream open reading frame protein-like isoform X1 n=1 Tax=Brienomyrus brachyistius TaxID=42636 RepID=UPI0020B2272D|nr:SLC35A4 upstream open reading frame protein-like isoform X1 [Brienomyrus brachyistius]